MAYGSSNILDQDVITELLEVGDADFLRDLFETFIDDAHKKLDGMSEALTIKDTRKLSELAHTFKGASGNIGAIGLSNIADNLQRIDDDAQLESATHMVNELKELYTLVEDAMKTEMQKHS